MKLFQTLWLVPLLIMPLLAGCSKGSVITMEEYEQVADGMSYAQVVSIVGEEGKENSSTTVRGVPSLPNFPSAIIFKSYIWKNHDDSTMTCVFHNDKLVTKSQVGL